MPSFSSEHHYLLDGLYRRRRLIIGALIFVIFALVATIIGIYQWSLQPRDMNSTQEVRVVIEPGDTAAVIADKLYENDVIRSALAFRVYSELTNTKDNLQAGGYALTPSLSVADIIDHLSTGRTDEFNVRILPGLTLIEQQDPEYKGSLASQGFSPEEIKEAFSRSYDHPVLNSRPAGASLEGYIYPDTYRISASGALSEVLELSFDELQEAITANDIATKLSARNLSLHQGLTLASIVQKEVSNVEDQRKVAQVFYNRLAIDMPLGSDVTFIYAAELEGVNPTINIDSPYNTRVVKGLPPGPIANFNLSALLAVTDPEPNEFLYFVASYETGDTYYARTLEEHETNVERYNSAARTEFAY